MQRQLLGAHPVRDRRRDARVLGWGDPKLPKERLEAFGGGVSAVLDDFRTLEIFRGGKRRTWKSAQDKGHRAEIERFVAAVKRRRRAAPHGVVPRLDRLTLALVESLRTGETVDLQGSDR